MNVPIKKFQTILAIILSVLATLIIFTPPANAGGGPPPPPPIVPVPGMGWTAQPSAGYVGWYGIASSDDGSTIIAAPFEGYIQVSHNFGQTWSAQIEPGFNSWFGVTVSSDGKVMAAPSAISGGGIWISRDSGAHWANRYSIEGRGFAAIASSSDGSRLVAGLDVGNLFLSSDYGQTWTEQPGADPGVWVSIKMSSDGAKIVASDLDGQRVMTSADYGVTWLESLVGPKIVGVASSSDGTHLVAAAEQGGEIYTSADSGLTWVDRTSLGAGDWYGAASSGDGSTIIVGGNSLDGWFGGVYISRDFGQTWIQQTWFGEGVWFALASSIDGHRFVAGSLDYSYISTYYLPYSSSTLHSLTPATISMDQNEITCSSGTLLYSSEGHGAEPAVLTSASFRLVSSTGVAATSSSMGTSAHFARSSLTSGERYTCQIVAIEKDAMATLSTEDLILKEKVLQTERADLAVVVSNYYLARSAALTTKNTAVAELMASDDHSNRGDRLTQILESYHRAIDQALSNKEMATKAAHAKSAATLATAGVSVVN